MSYNTHNPPGVTTYQEREILHYWITPLFVYYQCLILFIRYPRNPPVTWVLTQPPIPHQSFPKYLLNDRQNFIIRHWLVFFYFTPNHPISFIRFFSLVVYGLGSPVSLVYWWCNPFSFVQSHRPSPCLRVPSLLYARLGLSSRPVQCLLEYSE